MTSERLPTPGTEGPAAVQGPDPDDPGAPVHEPLAGPPPTPDEVRRMLAGVIDPELRTSIVDLGMVGDGGVGGVVGASSIGTFVGGNVQPAQCFTE